MTVIWVLFLFFALHTCVITSATQDIDANENLDDTHVRQKRYGHEVHICLITCRRHQNSFVFSCPNPCPEHTRNKQTLIKKTSGRWTRLGQDLKKWMLFIWIFNLSTNSNWEATSWINSIYFWNKSYDNVHTRKCILSQKCSFPSLRCPWLAKPKLQVPCPGAREGIFPHSWDKKQNGT